MYAIQASGSRTSTARELSAGILRSLTSGNLTSAPVKAATSRAMPTILKASARLAVVAKSKITSFKPNRGRTSSPGLRSSSVKICMPSESFSKPNSVKEQIIPAEGSPRNLVGLSLRLIAGKYVPTVATGTKISARTLEAPQTILKGSPAPISTLQTLNLSALGCLSRWITLPTTTPSAFAPKSINSSNSNPAIVSTLPKSSGDILISISSFSQFRETRISSLVYDLFTIRCKEYFSVKSLRVEGE